MKREMTANTYTQAIQTIKNAILKSRYRAAALANRELLSLYYGIEEFISNNSREGFWGTGAIDTISQKLQQELPGLRGFSPVNIKRMRLFYEAWVSVFLNRPLSTDDLVISSQEIDIHAFTSNRQLSTGDLSEEQAKLFFSIGFTHHCEILVKTQVFEERIFYIEHCATEFWSVENLKYYLKSNLYKKQGKLPNNFQTTISDKDLQRKALLSFKDEYLLDYINIESPDD